MVQAGDQLGTIANRFRVSVNDLVSANPGIGASSALYAGQQLTLPQGARQVPTASITPATGVIGLNVTLAATGFGANQPVRVRFGQVNGASAALEVLNTDANGAILKQYAVPYWPNVVTSDGQYFFFVERTDAPSVIAMSNAFYLAGTGGLGGSGVPVTGRSPFIVVQEGDTVSRIAAANQMSTEDRLALNPAIGSNGLVYPGQRLFLAPASPIPVPAGPRVSVTPVVVRAGDTLQVRAENFPPNAIVDVRIARQGQNYSGVVDGQADARGVVSAQIRVPLAARPGERWVVTVVTTETVNAVQAVSGAVAVVSP
jgi:LysM repeat protein